MAFITIDGENQIAAKQGGGGTLNIASFVLANIDGLGAEPINRIEAMPASADIMDTLAVTKSGYVNTNQVVYSLVMDSAIGDYDFNWVGLIDDEGVLVAVTYTPLIQKRKTVGAVPGNNLTRNFLIAFSGIQATAAIAVPADTWQIDFNARLLGIDERERLSNYDIYGDASFFDTGWSLVRQGATTTYDVLSGVGYVGGIRLASPIDQQITVDGPPKSVWLDVSLQGDISDMSALIDFIIDNVAHANYTDANGFNHYLTKIAEVAADGTVTDFRASADSIAAHEAKSDPHPQYLTDAEADSAYEPIGEVATHEGKNDPHQQYELVASRPVGSIVLGLVAPSSDWLAADGSGLSDGSYAEYKAYFDADPYGFIAQWNATCAALGKPLITSVAGVTTIPDMSTLFFRSGTAGILEIDQFKSHAHSAVVDNTLGNAGFGGGGGYPDAGVSTLSAGGSETRPVNIALPTWIKVK